MEFPMCRYMVIQGLLRKVLICGLCRPFCGFCEIHTCACGDLAVCSVTCHGGLSAMNTVLGRFNAVFAYALPVLAVLTFLCFATVALKTRTLEDVNISAAPGIQL